MGLYRGEFEFVAMSPRFPSRNFRHSVSWVTVAQCHKWGDRCSARVTSARNNFGSNLWTSAPNVYFGTEFHWNINFGTEFHWNINFGLRVPK